MLEQRSVDVGTLFGNLAEVIDVSGKFLSSLRQEVNNARAQAQAEKVEPEEGGASAQEQRRVGKCFLEHAPAMKKVYTEYCVNNDKVRSWERYGRTWMVGTRLGHVAKVSETPT